MVTSHNDSAPGTSQTGSPDAAPSLSAIAAARIAVGVLIDGGVQHVVVSPGSRSAPMAYALA
ncbi:MAG TPA: 2-succinyl-5-enolpyruvyl-6-hydroxy-3-cyclohexene-1-carboxylate synthase, partial [Arthrobacter sp.]|nr:2-succinyl-5-enolpyruvyl-6-hydroxy-3-cyclohexene-1-carboxylate synthase [Arthrobacter sp.]